jgi:hypothetical protein
MEISEANNKQEQIK